MATFNGERYIREQVDSILMQLSVKDELIISDDGSTDSTLDILEKYSDCRIHLLLATERLGVIGNFERALNYAKGDIIFLADQDDVWMNEKYNIMCSYLNEYDLVVCDSIIVDSNLNVICNSFFDYFGSGPGIMKNILRSSYYGSCMAFKKELLQKSLPFPKTKEIGHDLWIGLVGELVGKVLFLRQSLIKYRRHDATMTSLNLSLNRSSRSLSEKIAGRIIMVANVCLYYLKYLCINNIPCWISSFFKHKTIE